MGVQAAAGLPDLATDYCATWPAVSCAGPARQAANRKVQQAAPEIGSCVWAGLICLHCSQAVDEMSDPPAFSQQARLRSLQRAWWGLVQRTGKQQEACTLPEGALHTETKGKLGEHPGGTADANTQSEEVTITVLSSAFRWANSKIMPADCPGRQTMCTACSVAEIAVPTAMCGWPYSHTLPADKETSRSAQPTR